MLLFPSFYGIFLIEGGRRGAFQIKTKSDSTAPDYLISYILVHYYEILSAKILSNKSGDKKYTYVIRTYSAARSEETYYYSASHTYIYMYGNVLSASLANFTDVTFSPHTYRHTKQNSKYSSKGNQDKAQRNRSAAINSLLI